MNSLPYLATSKIFYNCYRNCVSYFFRGWNICYLFNICSLTVYVYVSVFYVILYLFKCTCTSPIQKIINKVSKHKHLPTLCNHFVVCIMIQVWKPLCVIVTCKCRFVLISLLTDIWVHFINFLYSSEINSFM